MSSSIETPLLDARGLCKRFGEVQAVDRVSFSVRPGEIYGLLGPNGAGKTTTISLVCGLLRPDTGSVAVCGADFAADPQAARRAMGVVPQELALYEELSGRENLEFWGRVAGLSARESRARAGELLETLALADRAKDAVKKYSGGMKRRINLGCALMHRPKLLLLDEPTVGIDPQARANIIEFIRALAAAGTGILYTTHYLEEAETLCARIGIIDHGRLHAEGTLEELQKRTGEGQFFVLEGALAGVQPGAWPGFAERFRIVQQDERRLVVAALGARRAAEVLEELLALPVAIDNVTVKKPSLNDTFLALTGRALRE
ncbi:ABC transporter ATP-binding protein [Opitutales bacterium ASA1]|uniref:ABC transporter ATP-binding protein n=1 Tax=Congregicoccus parvus TaxID=3081749 RepID=UPI002B2A7D7B|nr:ABC transporter ATP-binding protein [Opitutales bacterium ASA1]